MATNGPVTISDIEKHCHLPQGSLDKECTPDHIREIAREMDSWDLVAAHLKLSKPVIEAIDRDCNSQEGKKLATLTKWHEQLSFKATYKELATTFLVIKRADIALKLCNIIASQKNLPSSRSPAQSALMADPTAQQGSEIIPGSPSDPSIPTGKNLIVKKIERKFLEVVRKVIVLYTRSNIHLHELKLIATHLSSDLKGELGPFFKEERSKINEAKSINDLFAILSDFWDYLQPDLLVYLVEQCENNEAKMVVSEYEEELAKYRKQITLQEYIGKRLCNLDDDDRSKIALRLGNEWHEKTLDDLEKMRNAFSDRFSLLRLVPKLHGLKPGSITVVFSLPKSVKLNHDQLLKFFRRYNPLQVMVDGVTIYYHENAGIECSGNTTENTKEENQDHENTEKLETEKFHPPAGSDTKQVTDWVVTIEGKKRYGAFGSRDILFIVSSESLQSPDIVPRREVELTKEDTEKLHGLNLPPEQWKDGASIMTVRVEEDRHCSVVGVERSTPEDKLTREHVLKRIERLMNETTKQGVTIHYIGPGKRNTGDWCFEDGYITFRDLALLYGNCFKGRALNIFTDCSYSGSWVKELMKFLDEQGVRPCGHSAREKEMLIKVFASCQPTEIPYRLLFSVRSFRKGKTKENVSTGRVLIEPSGFEVAKEQHICVLNPTKLRCGASSFKEPCTILPDFTWEKRETMNRIYLARGTDPDSGQPSWSYVLLNDDNVNIEEFQEKITETSPIDLTRYRQVIKSGLGSNPPDDEIEWMRKNYCGQ